MIFFKILKRAFGSILETVNLVSVTILAVVWLLTADEKLLRIGVAAELAYIVLALLITTNWFTSSSLLPANIASLLKGYRRRLDTWLSRYPKTNGSEDDLLLDQVLLIVTVAGFAVIAFFGFGKHLLSYQWPELTHAQGWEAGAIVWTGLFLIYYLFKTSPTRSVKVNKLIMVVLIGVNAWLWWKAWKSIGGHEPLEHIGWIMGIAAAFLVIDLIVSIFHDNDIERARSRASLIWADAPMVFSFTVLYIYLRAHSDTEAPEVFVAGVVACQLLISNVVFVVMEFGLLGLPHSEINRDLPKTAPSAPEIAES